MKIKNLQIIPSLSKSFYQANADILREDGKDAEVRMRVSLEWLMDELAISDSKDPEVEEWFKRELLGLDQQLLSDNETLLVWRYGKWSKAATEQK